MVVQFPTTPKHLLQVPFSLFVNECYPLLLYEILLVKYLIMLQKLQTTEDIKLVLYALMLLQRPSAHLLSWYKTTVQQPAKPMTTDSGNWIYPRGTGLTLTGFSPGKSSGWSRTCEHTERLSQSPGQQGSYHELCWRRLRSVIRVPCASGSVWTLGLLDFGKHWL